MSGLIFAAGCGGSGGGSEQAFASGLEANLLPACFEVPSRFPTFKLGVAFRPETADSVLAMAGPEPIPALFRVGFIKPTLGQRTLTEGFPIPQVRYDLTPAGKAAYQDSIPHHDGDPGFCYAERSLEKILKVYEPEEASPKGPVQKFVVVTFTYRNEVADWARHPAISRQFPSVRRALSNAVEPAMTSFVLTDAGWQVTHDSTMTRLLGEGWAENMEKSWQDVADRATNDLMKGYGPS